MYDPLLDTNVRFRTWYDIAEELQGRIAWVAHKGRPHEAFKWLNVLDLIDSEASAYWRETGLDLYNGGQTAQPASQGRVQLDELARFTEADNPLFD